MGGWSVFTGNSTQQRSCVSLGPTLALPILGMQIIAALPGSVWVPHRPSQRSKNGDSSREDLCSSKNRGQRGVSGELFQRTMTLQHWVTEQTVTSFIYHQHGNTVYIPPLHLWEWLYLPKSKSWLLSMAVFFPLTYSSKCDLSPWRNTLQFPLVLVLWRKLEQEGFSSCLRINQTHKWVSRMLKDSKKMQVNGMLITCTITVTE